MTQVSSKFIASSKENPLYTTPFGHQVDRFGRLRVSNAEVIYEFDNRFPVYFDTTWSKKETGAGTVTHTLDAISYDLNVGTAVNDEAIMQTRQFIPYTRGHSQLIYWTGHFHPLKAGLRQRSGYFSVNNGMFIETDGTDVKLVLRSKISGTVSDTNTLPRADWIDKLDGTGPSGKTIDFNKQNFFFASFGHLGIADVVFSVLIGSEVIEFAVFESANILNDSWAQSGSLPFRFEIKNTTSQGSSSSMRVTCGSVQSEGGSNTIGHQRFISNDTTVFNVTDVDKCLVAIRLKDIYNESSLTPQSASFLMPSGNKEVYWRLLYNPIITGGTWVDADASIVECNKTVTSISGGVVVGSGHLEIGGSGEARNYRGNLKLGSNIDGDSDVLALVMRTTSTTADILYTANWREDT